jgi:hypothetical protein
MIKKLFMATQGLGILAKQHLKDLSAEIALEPPNLEVVKMTIAEITECLASQEKYLQELQGHFEGSVLATTTETALEIENSSNIMVVVPVAAKQLISISVQPAAIDPEPEPESEKPSCPECGSRVTVLEKRAFCNACDWEERL